VDAILRRCPRVRLLVTSREPLGIGGEAIYQVPSMSLPADDAASGPAPGEPLGASDAVALFVPAGQHRRYPGVHRRRSVRRRLRGRKALGFADAIALALGPVAQAAA
jgi:predicted ATPase